MADVPLAASDGSRGESRKSLIVTFAGQGGRERMILSFCFSPSKMATKRHGLCVKERLSQR